VDEQREDLLSQGVPSSPCLTLRGLNRYDHISQEPGVYIVGERKRQYISRLVFVPILTIQLVDRLIRHEGQAQLSRFLFQVT